MTADLAAPDFGVMITEARRRKGLTQKQLADMVRKGQPAVCGWEKNRARPSLGTLADLSRVLGLDLGELTLAAGEPPGSRD